MNEKTSDTSWMIALSILTLWFSMCVAYIHGNLPDSKAISASMLNIAENSHFVGCVRASADYDTCEVLSKQYRDLLGQGVGL